MDDIENKFTQWQNGELSDSELLMWTMVARRRLFEMETELLNAMRAAETKIADARMARLGIAPIE